jgi:hypothetical protein
LAIIDICGSLPVKFIVEEDRHGIQGIQHVTRTFLDMEIKRAVTHSRNWQILSEIDAVINMLPSRRLYRRKALQNVD